MIPKSRYFPLFAGWLLPKARQVTLLCDCCHICPATIPYMDTRICVHCDRDMQVDPDGVVAEALTRHE